MFVYNSNGTLVGSVDDGGSILDTSSTLRGSVDWKGEVFNKRNMLVGYILIPSDVSGSGDRQTCAFIIGANGIVAGKLDCDGVIYQVKTSIHGQDEHLFKQVGHVKPLANFSHAGAAIWLLVEDRLFTIGETFPAPD